MKECSKIILVLLRTWSGSSFTTLYVFDVYNDTSTGLMYLCMNEMRAIRAVVDTLRIPSLQRRVCISADAISCILKAFCRILSWICFSISWISRHRIGIKLSFPAVDWPVRGILYMDLVSPAQFILQYYMDGESQTRYQSRHPNHQKGSASVNNISDCCCSSSSKLV